MLYKTIYMTHDVSTLVANKNKTTKKSTAICEMTDWDTALNKYAQEGWTVKKCGTIPASDTVIFWAMLKKTQKQMDI